MRQSLYCITCWGLFFAFTSCQNSNPATSKSNPNVIIIMTDDQGYGDLSCHGNPWLKTPNLDNLHGESLRLTDFHVGTTCSPTRAALMTGRNCNRVGVWHTIAGRSQLPAEEVTMAEVFAHNGYQTAMFGKWHLGDNPPFGVANQGFQHVFYHGGGGVGQMPDYWDNNYFDDTYFRGDEVEKTQGYCTDVWFDAALDFMDKQRSTEQPFFLYLATNAPHGPFQVDSSYLQPYLNQDSIPNPNFYGMIANLDENMGRLMQKLEEWDLADQTLLVFLTDNGTAGGVRFDQQGRLTQGYNAQMRGIKGSEYEGGHRVPCFLRWPEKEIGGGKDLDILTAHVDLLPTFIDLLDLASPGPLVFDGASLVGPLTGNTSDSIWNQRVIITDTQRDEWPEKWKKSATMQGSWRLINGQELYEIRNDPRQQQDLAEQHPDRVSSLREAYEAWWTELEPGFERYTRTVLGESEATLCLFSHDWHEIKDPAGQATIAPWHQIHIRQGKLANGYWAAQVAQKGRYRFELRRWPKELDAAIADSIPAMAAAPGGGDLPAGTGLPISQARLKVGDQEMSLNLEKVAKSAVFEMDLEPGPMNIQSWFEGPGQLSLGAYYVYVSQAR